VSMPQPTRTTPDSPPSRISRNELRLFGRRMGLLATVVLVTLGLGTLGFGLSEHVSAWYAFRWSLDTVSTLGSLPGPTHLGGQITSIALIVLGVGTLFYGLVTVTEFFVAGHLGELLAARRAQKMIDSFTDHHIICGFGRVGRQVARDLRAAGARYVIVDANPVNREFAQGVGVRFIEGDAADDEVLRSAGVERAASIVACADSDAENIFITLTARELRDDIAIVARASVEDSEKKLKRAGADRVISPYKSSGSEMARLALHPQIRGVVEVDSEYRMEEIEVADGCDGVHQTIGDIRGGAMIVGLRRGGRFAPQPPADTVLQSGDVLSMMGTSMTLDRLEQLFQPSRGSTSDARKATTR
jgi:voltage-gated potassium channel